jgi:hypothetical protein
VLISRAYILLNQAITEDNLKIISWKADKFHTTLPAIVPVTQNDMLLARKKNAIINSIKVREQCSG